MRRNLFRKTRDRHDHQYREQPIGAGLVRRVCEACGHVRMGRNAWPSIRWAVRNEFPAIFVPLRPTMFLSTPLWAAEEKLAAPRFGERRLVQPRHRPAA